MKKIIIIVLAVIITILIGVVLPILLNTPSSSLNKEEDQDNKYAIDHSVQASGDRSEVQKVNPINQRNNDTKKDKNANEEGDDKITKEDESKNQNTQSDSSENTDPSITSPDKNGTSGGSSNDSDTSDENDFLTEDWVEEMIKKHGHRIRENDLVDLRRLYSKVDIAYLNGISEGGITDEDLEEIKAYLHRTLGSDYARGRELYFMYSHLMMEI